MCGRKFKMIATSPDSERIKKRQLGSNDMDTIHPAIT